MGERGWAIRCAGTFAATNPISAHAPVAPGCSVDHVERHPGCQFSAGGHMLKALRVCVDRPSPSMRGFLRSKRVNVALSMLFWNETIEANFCCPTEEYHAR